LILVVSVVALSMKAKSSQGFQQEIAWFSQSGQGQKLS
jgi:hypothetical protein